MASIVNGLFAGRSGISSHGSAIAVVGDNISNSSTVGYKSARAEFSDLVAGGQASGRVVGSGSTISSIVASYEQGTLEFTGKPLDLAVDGNGFFAVADGQSRFYTRAGNFKTDQSGFIVDQSNHQVLGFAGTGATGDLQALNVNTVSQSSVATTAVNISANLDAGAAIVPVGTIYATDAAGAASLTQTTTYSQLNSQAAFSSVVNIFDSLGAKHTVTYFFFHTAANQYTARGYVNSEEVDVTGTATGLPRQIGSSVTLNFAGDGSRSNAPAGGAADLVNISVPAGTATAWTNGASLSTMSISFTPITQYSAPSNILSITQNGQGIGTVTSVDINKDGKIFALLSNGQSAIIGTIGLVSFSNPEGLTRVGGSLLQQSGESGEPIIGKPQTGTFGSIQSGSLELSTVDIANEFVRLITLQRGFQASSRIITTINSLLNEVIQLA